MEHKSRKIGLNATFSVPEVTYNRVPDRIEVNPKLVAPPRAGKCLHERRRYPAFLDVKVRFRGLAALIHSHPAGPELSERFAY